jgi:hypothetical protein
MPTYAYRWADGSVSLCSARNKNEAMSRFDTVRRVSRKLILRLASPIFFTVRPSVDQWWVLDEEAPLEFLLSQEMDLVAMFPDGLPGQEN